MIEMDFTKLRVYSYKDLEKMFDIELEVLDALGTAAKTVLERDGVINETNYSEEANKLLFDAIFNKYGEDDDVLAAFMDILKSKSDKIDEMIEKYDSFSILKNV